MVGLLFLITMYSHAIIYSIASDNMPRLQANERYERFIFSFRPVVAKKVNFSFSDEKYCEKIFEEKM